jgi:hypothetical protein
VDPAGNWVRVLRRSPAAAPTTDAAGASAVDAYATRPEGRLARALDDAVVQADSHGDPVQARKILAGALRRAGDDADAADRVRALAYLAELAVRAGDPDAARTHLDDLDVLAGTLAPDVRTVVGPALADAADLRTALPR